MFSYAKGLPFFFMQCLNSPNSIVRLCAMLALGGSASYASSNLSFLSFLTRAPRGELNTSLNFLKTCFESDNIAERASLIHDLLNMRTYKYLYDDSTSMLTLDEIYFSLKHEYITPVLYGLHWLPVKERIVFKTLIFVHKCLFGCAPAYLKNLLTPLNHQREN